MDCTKNHPVTLTARVLEVNCCDLLVCDCDNHQKVLVHTDNACRFCVGDIICIRYNGVMTMSIPPQISAKDISRGPCC